MEEVQREKTQREEVQREKQRKQVQAECSQRDQAPARQESALFDWDWLEDLVCYPRNLTTYLNDADLDYVKQGWKTGFQIRRFTH